MTTEAREALGRALAWELRLLANICEAAGQGIAPAREELRNRSVKAGAWGHQLALQVGLGKLDDLLADHTPLTDAPCSQDMPLPPSTFS